MSYAKETTVSVERTEGEIKRTISKFGASRIVIMTDHNSAMVAFVYEKWSARFKLRLPTGSDPHIQETAQGRSRSVAAQRAALEQERRRLWRALLLVVKAKIESVESGVEAFEEAFLGQIVIPGGETAAEWMIPQMRAQHATGKVLALMPKE